MSRKLVRPSKAYAKLDRKTVHLEFDKDASVAPTGEYYLRGGVCWPYLSGPLSDHSVEGFILMVGVHIESKKVYVFEQAEFQTVDHILGERGNIEYEGISAWLNTVWTIYFANVYYRRSRGGRVGIDEKYRLEVYRSKMIEPKPQIAAVAWKDETEAAAIMYELVALGRFVYPKDSRLYADLTRWQTQPGAVTASVKAMLSCLVGLDRHPWREPRGKK